MKKIIPFLLVLMLSVPAQAQNKSRIVGKTTTADGLVIIGATVTITSEELIGTSLSTTTSNRGDYRNVLLPLWTYYCFKGGE
jgi:hypothetical protein